MNNKDTISAVIGGTFFAIPYLALSTPILPSLLIGTAAFGAGELVLSGFVKESLKDINRPLWLVLEDAKKNNRKIIEKIPLIDDEEIRESLNSINDTVNKIIDTVTKNPEKADNINNFFEYYLPVVVKVLDRYDEIENQKLSSTEAKKFTTSTKKMISEADNSFKKILDNLYKSEMVDTDAEMKVFNSMLKADGIDDTDLNKEEKDG
ncbi:MAG: 5-bromo-4-chloroindolyl phosphate hydrolysis family protein [Bacilli bacterium]|nr:5-bromo-4-chloroindolyl phosphate hydrolysis family protein [Bacilli bacterium]